jgi:hypothetical protein
VMLLLLLRLKGVHLWFPPFFFVSFLIKSAGERWCNCTAGYWYFNYDSMRRLKIRTRALVKRQ